MKNSVALFLLILVARVCIGQSSQEHHWEKIGPIEFTALAWQSATTMIATTNHGYLYVSTDGGSHWEHRLFNDTVELVDIAFVDSLHGAVAERGGRIYFTQDGGATWIRSTVPVPPFVEIAPGEYLPGWLLAIAYPSPDTLFVTDYAFGAIWRTTNRGSSWEKLTLPDTVYTQSIYFLDAKRGFAGSNALYKTFDGGTTWEKQELTVFNDEGTTIHSIDFYGDTGVIGGFRQYWTTTNGGTDWTAHPLPDTINSPNGTTIHTQMDFVKLINGREFFSMLYGIDMPYLYSHDLGQTSTIATVGANTQVNDITYAPATGAVAVGNHGIVLRSLKGADWKVENYCRWAAQMGFATFGSQFYGIPLEDNRIFLSSSDAGVSWQSKLFPGREVESFSGLHFTSPEMGKVFTVNRLIKTFTTTDAGLTWDSVGATGLRGFRTVSFSGSTGYAASYEEIMVTTNDGASWVNIPVAPDTVSPFPDAVPVSTIIKGTFALDSLHGFAFTQTTSKVTKQVFRYHSRILRTDDAGKTWTVDPNAPIDWAHALYFRNERNGFIGSLDGKILRTTDGGLTWSSMQLPMGTIKAIGFVNDSVGFAAGIGKQFAMTTNTGESWQMDSLPIASYHIGDYNILSFLFADTSVYAITNEGMLRMSRSQVPANVEIGPHPSMYLLITTHPNPAASFLHCTLHGIFSNPTGILTAGMHDLLGRRVMDLTKEARDGNNGTVSQFSIDVSTIPPGIYTLQYALGSLSHAKQVIILK